jgi:hypothetical protein
MQSKINSSCSTMGDGELDSSESGAVEEEKSQGGDVIDKGVARRRV